jgi:Na+/H+ antiporter NhaD/arsenite permease-like protein
MIGSAAEIDFNTFFLRMGGIVFVAWLSILVGLRFLFSKELGVAGRGTLQQDSEIKDRRIWRASLCILGIMVVLFMLHSTFDWEPWFVAVLGLAALMFFSRRILVEHALAHVEITLLIFFIGLFMVIGGVEQSRFLVYVGQFITPFVENNLLVATIVLMWVGAFLSAVIDNIPFTAAMIPIILNLESQGINIVPLWWGLAMGVGLGGNGTHIGSTANVFIVTISERLARERNDPSLAITPLVWFKKGTPMMLLSLAVATVIFVVFFGFFSRPIH